MKRASFNTPKICPQCDGPMFWGSVNTCVKCYRANAALKKTVKAHGLESMKGEFAYVMLVYLRRGLVYRIHDTDPPAYGKRMDHPLNQPQ